MIVGDHGETAGGTIMESCTVVAAHIANFADQPKFFLSQP
jgi:hypothetical protein